MATVTSYGIRMLNNLPEYGNTYAIPTVSELTAYIGGATAQSGETITHARFYVELSTGGKLYSPDIPYNGVGEITYNLGIAQQNWVTIGSSFNYISMGWEVKSDLWTGGWVDNEMYYYWGWYGIGAQTLPYTQPVVSNLDVYRTTPSTAIEFLYSANVAEVSTNPSLINKLYYLFQWNNVGTWTDIGVETESSVLSLTDNTYGSSSGWDETTSYQMRIRLRDKFKTVYAYDVLPTVLVPLSVGKFGIGVGKIIENEDAALDVNGKFYRDNISQPKIFSKKPSDPDPSGMEDGDVLLIYNETQAFSSTNFPQEFGTGYTWAQAGVWPTNYLFWASTSSSNNSIVESIEASAWKADRNPIFMLNGNTAWDNNVMFPYDGCPATVILTFNGIVQFNSFTIWGWAQGHEIKNSPKSFAFFGSVDGHEWQSLYYTTAFPNTYNTSASASMNNSGLYFKYLKMVWITNQNDNNESDLTNATMISLRNINFNASGYYYV